MLTDISEVVRKFLVLEIVFIQTRTTKLSYSNCSCSSPTACQKLTYCTAAVKLSITKLNHLNACWNSVYIDVFSAFIAGSQLEAVLMI